MHKRPLGRTGIGVSALCLGSMTWGAQNSMAEGHAQIAHALERGVNFIDTAEMYPTAPIRAATTGRTEEIIEEWFARWGRRIWCCRTRCSTISMRRTGRTRCRSETGRVGGA